MGHSTSKSERLYNQHFENHDRAPNETRIYRNAAYADALRQYKHTNFHDLLKNTFRKYSPAKPFVVQRKVDVNGNGLNDVIEYSLGQVRSDAEHFGRGVLELDLAAWKQEYRHYKMRFLGIFADNSYKSIVQHFACLMHNLVSVPIFDTYAEKTTLFPFEETRMETLCLTVKHLNKMAEFKRAGKLSYLTTLIVFDEERLTEKAHQSVLETGLKLYTWSDIIGHGRNSPIAEWPFVADEDICSFCYTSGSSGIPKGAMYTHKGLSTSIQAMVKYLEFNTTDRFLNYFSIAHSFGRSMLFVCMVAGTKVHLPCGNLEKLQEDLAFHKPTIFAGPPRIYNTFYDAMWARIVANEGTVRGRLTQKAIRTKLQNLKKYGMLTHAIYDSVVFKPMRRIIGDEVRLMLSVLAPLNPEVADFFKIAMSRPMINAYGQTEAGMTFGMDLDDVAGEQIGGILPQNEFKIVDVPEMGYTSRDVDPETGLIVPRGELWIRGQTVIPRYYKNDAKNAETFTKDGWLRTGDVAKVVAPTNAVVIIDRKNNLFKLPSGSFIAPDKLESAYKTCSALFTDVYINGNSLKNSLVAVITIEAQNLASVARLIGMDQSAEEDQLFGDSKFEKKIIQLLAIKAEECKFVPHEVPKGIVFSSDPFSELGLVTGSFKNKRFEIKKHFMQQLSKRYETLD